MASEGRNGINPKQSNLIEAHYNLSRMKQIEFYIQLSTSDGEGSDQLLTPPVFTDSEEF